MEKIYQHIINIMQSVTSKFNDSTSVQRYEESLPDQCGIILQGSRDDEECISGETEWECIKLEIQVTCKNEASDIFENLQILRNFVDAFEDSNSTVDGLEIVWAKHLGSKVRPTYMNGYGLQTCKCIIDINYLLEEN